MIEALETAQRDHFGNPSSPYQFGRSARRLIDSSRDSLASALGCKPSELIFTSGGTESNNLAIKGFCRKNPKGHCGHIITSSIEHHSVLNCCRSLEGEGFSVTYLEVDSSGRVYPEQVEEALLDDTILISIHHANNEVGTLEPIREIAQVANRHQVLFHTDSVQSFLKIPIQVNELGVDFLSISGHKINGPKGVGALYVRGGIKIDPEIHGGEQERGFRSGTENVAGIAGFGTAVEMGLSKGDSEWEIFRKLRDDLETRIKQSIPDVQVNGHFEDRLPGTSNVSFPGARGESLLIRLDMAGIAVSTGSACSTGSLSPSHVLTAMGIPYELNECSLRFSFGLGNSKEDVDRVMEHLPFIVSDVRKSSPVQT